MIRRISAILLATGLAQAATTTRAPTAIQPFEALPAPDHTVRPTDLAWLDDGLATLSLGTASEVQAAVSAPHFQVVYGQRTLSLEDASSGDHLWNQTNRALRLSTALATSQIGLGGDAFDLAFGASFSRDKRRFDTLVGATGARGVRQSADLSAAVRLGAWRIGGGVLDAIDIGSDSGVSSDPRVAVDIGRAAPEGFQAGMRLEIPWRAGHEAGLRIGVGRDFRRSLAFSAELGTTYREQTDSVSLERKLVRASLEASLGTSLRFRPRQDSDPAWIAALVDPFSAGSSVVLRGVQMGVQGTWDLVRGGGRASFSLGRAF